MYGKDSSKIVVDEFVGMQVTFIALRASLTVGLIGLFLFRLFDIVKPFPVGASQKLRGGVGVVADDILAAIYSRAVLIVLVRLFHIG